MQQKSLPPRSALLAALRTSDLLQPTGRGLEGRPFSLRTALAGEGARSLGTQAAWRGLETLKPAPWIPAACRRGGETHHGRSIRGGDPTE